MIDRDQIIAAVFNAVDEANEASESIKLKKSLDQPLYGEEGALDSLGVVNLIVAVEEAIEDEHNVTITLADERAMSQKRSPFRSIETLVDYIAILVNGGATDA